MKILQIGVFCDFYAFRETRVVNATLFLLKGCHRQKWLGTYELKIFALRLSDAPTITNAFKVHC